MFKLMCSSVLVLLFVLQLQQPADAFIIAYQAVPVATPVVTTVTSPAVPVQDIQAITNSIVTSKINLFSTLVNTAIQLKANILQSYANALNSVQPIQPVVYTKTIQPVTYTKTLQPVVFTKRIYVG